MTQWQDPYTEWSPLVGVKANDFNRIEGNIDTLRRTVFMQGAAKSVNTNGLHAIGVYYQNYFNPGEKISLLKGSLIIEGGVPAKEGNAIIVWEYPVRNSTGALESKESIIIPFEITVYPVITQYQPFRDSVGIFHPDAPLEVYHNKEDEAKMVLLSYNINVDGSNNNAVFVNLELRVDA